MTITVDLTLLSLIDDTEIELYRGASRPGTFVLDTNALSNASDTSADYTSTSEVAPKVTDIIQLGDELMTVTSVATRTMTLVRGFDGSTAKTAGHAAAVVGGVNPTWPRHRISRALQRGCRALNTWLPNLVNTTITVGSDRLEELSADTQAVTEVRLQYSEGQIVPVGGWTFHEDLPTAVSSTTVGLSLPAIIQENDVIYVTRSTMFLWADVSVGGGAKTESPEDLDTVTLPQNGADLLSLFAAAYLMMGHEMSREELASVEEWSQEQAIRQGVNLRMLNIRWQAFYRRLDEVRRAVKVPRRRAYNSMARIS